MKILCMGQIIYDYSLPIDGFPLEGLKYNLKEKIECSGGGACNASYLLAKWNEDVHISAAVGGDELGNKIRKNMEEAGINTSNVETVFEAKTPIEFILINKNTGNKTVFSINESSPHVKKYELDFVPDIILLDGYEYTSAISVVNRFPNATVILDASIQERSTVEMLNYAKYIIASQSFAEEFTDIKADFNNPTTLLELYKKFAVKYPNNNLVITLKDHGAMYLDGNQIKVMPGMNVDKIVDNTGAGDIFRAAFAAGVSRGYDMDKIIRIANIAAGLSLSKLGAKNSIPLFSDVASIYESKFGPIDGSANNQVQSDISTNKEQTPPVESQESVEQPSQITEQTAQAEQENNVVNGNNNVNYEDEPSPLDQVVVPDIDIQAMPQENDENDGTF